MAYITFLASLPVSVRVVWTPLAQLLFMLIVASQPPQSSVCASAFPAMKINEPSHGKSCQRKPVKTS